MKNEQHYCHFPRRLAIMFYDSLLLFSVLFVATALILPLTHGEAVSSHNLFYTVYLIFVSYIYFVWQWTHGGQTLGMMSWRVRLEEDNNEKVSWKRGSLRFLLALPSVLLAGLGLIWIFIDKDKRSLHGRYSGTQLKRLPK